MIKFFLSFSLISLISLISPASSLAQSQAWTGRCVSNGDVATIQGLECLFYNLLQVITFFAGLAFLFMFISGGFSYMFTNGDPKKTAAASSQLTMAIAGLVGIVASYFILRFIQNFTGVNVLEFKIPG